MSDVSDALEDLAWNCELPVPNWKFVLVAMAYDCTSSEGFYDGGIETLAELTGLSDSAVANALIGLESRGLICKAEGGAVDGYKMVARPSPVPKVKTPQIDS